MGLRSMKRRVENIERVFQRLVTLLPGERELWGHIRQQMGEPDLVGIAALWAPVVHRAMRRRGYGDGRHSKEEIREYMIALKDEPRPPYTINLFLPSRPIPDASPGGLVLEGCFPLGHEADREDPDSVSRGGRRDSDIELETHLRIESLSNGDVGGYREVIMDSDSRADWNRIVTDRLEEVHDFLADKGLRIVCDHGSEDVDAGIVDEEWATKHQNPEARASRYRIYVGDSQVEEIVLVGVDGGRARLPWPRDVDGSLVVDLFEYKVAEIVSLGGELEEYMGRSGLNIPAISTPGSGSVRSISEGLAPRSRTDRTPQE